MNNTKTLYDGGKVITGLVIFVILVTLPFWYNHGKAAPEPQPQLTAKAKAEKACVRPKSIMKATHMQILNGWRNNVVRNARRIWETADGKRFNMSLSKTCLDCHSNKEKFCDTCHNYAAVAPYCWDCHIDKVKEAKE